MKVEADVGPDVGGQSQRFDRKGSIDENCDVACFSNFIDNYKADLRV